MQWRCAMQGVVHGLILRSVLLVLVLIGSVAQNYVAALTLVKYEQLTSLTINCSKLTVRAPAELSSETARLRELLAERRIEEAVNGLPIKLAVAPIRVREAVRKQSDPEIWRLEGYELKVTSASISITAQQPAGVFYGIQTLAHLLSDNTSSVSACEIVDWPDLPLRMVMLDPARQNENFDYYRRVIRFCARQKLNAILFHLTDDQTAALYEPNYPELMHPHAWRPEEARALNNYAKQYHIQLVPEIECCGHSRMFTRRADFRDYLHQTTGTRAAGAWLGTDEPGYTNVLCPASEKSYEYIERMINAAAKAFDSPVIHLGFDEVDMTTCARCTAKWPSQPPEFWFAQQLTRCMKIVEKHSRKSAVWGDMLLKHPGMLEGIDPKWLVIYDWQYHPDVTPESSRFFTSRGFEVVACPSLMCHPHIVLPDELNYNNVRTFAKVAREEKLAGLNTTFWIPTRYLSGAMCPAFAYAGAQAWSGSNFDKQRCFGAFAAEHFGLRDAAAFTRMWDQLATATLHIREFEAATYIDDKGLSQAREMMHSQPVLIRQKKEALESAERYLDSKVSRHQNDWRAMQCSAWILKFALERLENLVASKRFDEESYQRWATRQLRAIVEYDWNINRYPDDPNLSGKYTPGQNLAWRFKQLSAKP
jgi:hypothetical protein